MAETKMKYCIPKVKGTQLSCTLVGVLGVLFNLRDIAVLLHGTAGCAHYGLRFCEQMFLREHEVMPAYRFPDLKFRTTGLSEKELIFGGEDTLRAKIHETLRTFPGIPLIVIPSCTVEVIGDDVEGICRTIQEETGREIVCLKMGGFLGGDHYQGVNSVYADLIDHFLKPADRTDPLLVNLVAERGLGATSDIEAAEIRRLLGLLRLSINRRFVRNLSFNDIPGVARAGLNLPAIRNQTIEVCQYLKQKFGMPFIDEGFPCGFVDLRVWLEAIAEELDLDADIPSIVASEQAFFLKEIDRLGNPFKGVKVVLNTIPMALGWLGDSLEMTGAQLQEVNILKTAYFPKELLDAASRFPCPVNQDMTMEDILENNRQVKTDLFLQCSIHNSAIPNHQPGLLVKEVPVLPPVGPRGLLNFFFNWAQWMNNPVVEGWRYEPAL